VRDPALCGIAQKACPERACPELVEASKGSLKPELRFRRQAKYEGGTMNDEVERLPDFTPMLRNAPVRSLLQTAPTELA
jgi:hypothetical protein